MCNIPNLQSHFIVNKFRRIQTLSCARTLVQTLVPTYSRTLARTHTRMHARTHACTHAYTRISNLNRRNPINWRSSNEQTNLALGCTHVYRGFSHPIHWASDYPHAHAHVRTERSSFRALIFFYRIIPNKRTERSQNENCHLCLIHIVISILSKCYNTAINPIQILK